MSAINTPSEMSSTYIHKYNLKNMSDIILIDFALRKYFNQFPRNCKFDVFCQKIWKCILNHEDVVFNKEENIIWADIQSLMVDGQNKENNITICDLKERESISLETFFYNIFNILDCSIRFIEYKTNIQLAFLSAKKIPHDGIISVLFKELDEIEVMQLIKNSLNDNSINSINIIKLKYLDKTFELIESFLISSDFSVEPSFYGHISRFLKEFDIFQSKSSDLFCQFMIKIIYVGILLDALKIDDCRVVLNSMQKDPIFIKNLLIELIRLFAIKSIRKSNILDKHEKNASYIQDSISIEHVLKTRVSSQLMTKIDFSTVQNFIILIFTTKPFFMLNEKYQTEICSEIYKYMDFQLVQKIQNNQILQQNVNILPILQAISYQTDSRYKEQYHHLFSVKITEFFKKRELFKLQKIIEYFAVFVIKNEMTTPDIYDFLKFDASTYKNFLIAFFKKIPIRKTLFHHVQSFFDYFLKTKNLVFVDVFNFIPFISREHKNLLDIFYYIHQIMCQKYCYINYYEGSFEKLMLPFLLRMPALFYKKNDHLIYHSEKLKLQNYNYSGILEYLQDENTLSCDLKKVFRKMHTEIKLRNEFKEEYIRKIILLALKNEYESADQLIIIILECLFDNFVYDFPLNDSSSVYSKFSNDKSLIFQREQSNYSLLDVNNDGFHKIDTCSTIKQSFSLNENEFEKVTRKEIRITYLIYSFEFHQKFQLLIQREFAYMSIYKRILLTLRIETPHFYTHIVYFYQFPVFFNFSFPFTLSHHLQINKMIIDFILTFPSNVSIDPDPTSSTTSFFSKGSSVSLNTSTKSDINEFYDKIVEINSLLHSRIMYNDQTLQDDIMIKEPDILQYESTFMPQKFFKSIFHYPKFDFFIDMIHMYINSPQKVRSTINFLLICIKEDFNLNLLHVILKIYNLLKIHEPVIDEILERSIAHVDFTLDIYKALGTVTDGFYKFFFNSAHNAVKKDTILTQIDFKNIPEYKQDFILNTFFLIRRLKIPAVKLSKHRLFKGYILSNNEFIDITTTINTNYTGAYEACLNIDEIDLFHIPQLVQYSEMMIYLI